MGDIIVLIKAALNPEMIRSRPDGTLDVDSIPLKLSDIDRNAVEEASKLKGKLGGKIIAVTILTIGPRSKRDKELKMAVQEALAKGVDEAIVLADDDLVPGDQVQTANAIVEVIKKQGLQPALILASEASIDETTGQIAGRVAAKLGLPYLSFVRKIDVADGKIVVERDLEEDIEVVEAPLPAVVSVTQEINQPRPPTLIQIRRAGKKPQKWITGSDIGFTRQTKREILERKVITVSRKQVIIEGKSLEETAEKLIEALVSEGVLKL